MRQAPPPTAYPAHLLRRGYDAYPMAAPQPYQMPAAFPAHPYSPGYGAYMGASTTCRRAADPAGGPPMPAADYPSAMRVQVMPAMAAAPPGVPRVPAPDYPEARSPGPGRPAPLSAVVLTRCSGVAEHPGGGAGQRATGLLAACYVVKVQFQHGCAAATCAPGPRRPRSHPAVQQSTAALTRSSVLDACARAVRRRGAGQCRGSEAPACVEEERGVGVREAAEQVPRERARAAQELCRAVPRTAAGARLRWHEIQMQSGPSPPSMRNRAE